MKDLKVIDLYSNTNNKKIDSFNTAINSSVDVAYKLSDYKYDGEWLTKIEETLKFIENILKNPNRFIINEEEVVKIELARKITVESIKHLSKNTGFIQEFDEKTGDVKPSKILNINKEESFNTYENRFIFSLIKSIGMFIDKKKQSIKYDFVGRSEKMISYNANTNVDHEKLDISLKMNSIAESNPEIEKQNQLLAERIKKIEEHINELKRSEIYTTLSKANVSMVVSPIKKTNMILKNNNFQAAVELWNYLQLNLDDNSKVDNIDTQIKDDAVLKELYDEIFALNYVVSRTIGEKEEIKERQVSEYLINNLIQKIVVTNSDLTKKEVKDMIEKNFVYVKKQTMTNNLEILKIYKNALRSTYKKMIKTKLRRKMTNAKKNRQTTV